MKHRYINGFQTILQVFTRISAQYPIVAIHQLPRIQETLWLRILGRGTVQRQAIDELLALPLNNPFRRAALELLYNLRQNLRVNQNQEEDDGELIMRLEPLYQQDREQAIQEGNKQGEERLIILLLNQRFGEIDSSLLERIKALSIEQLENLARNLLDFSAIDDLETWLNQQA